MHHTHLQHDNSRGRDYGVANPSYALIGGEQAGVRVGAHEDGTRFTVYMTHGSEGSASDVLLGTVHANDGEPKFVPAGDLLKRCAPAVVRLLLGDPETAQAIDAAAHELLDAPTSRAEEIERTDPEAQALRAEVTGR